MFHLLNIKSNVIVYLVSEKFYYYQINITVFFMFSDIITWTTQLIFKAVPCEYVPESSPEEEELQESNQQEE